MIQRDHTSRHVTCQFACQLGIEGRNQSDRLLFTWGVIFYGYTTLSHGLSLSPSRYTHPPKGSVRNRCFSSRHERGTKKKFLIPMRKRTSDLRSDALLPFRAQNLPSLFFYHDKHDAIDVVDSSCSMQDTYHMNFEIQLAYCRVSVAQW